MDKSCAPFGLRFLEFTTDSIKLYFAQIENYYCLANITKNEDKFAYTIVNIHSRYLDSVSNIVISPPATGKFETLSQRLTEQFGDSKSVKVRKLLSKLQLGDDKLSALLRKMSDLGGKKLSPEFFQQLWISRLPLSVQQILSVATCTENAAELAKLAGKVCEVTANSHQLAAVQQRVKNNLTHDEAVV